MRHRLTPSRALLALALATLAAPPTVAQQPKARAARIGAAPAAAAEVAGVMLHDGALLGVARSYRATFGERGLEFLPVLGKQAERAEPFGIRLASLQRGDAMLLDASKHVPQRRHDRAAVEYQWPIAIERYEAKAEGLEQSFVFGARPRGRGDLRVLLDITTALPRAPSGEIAFRNARGGGVTVGAVTGIDANGARCAGAVTFTATGLQLSLPGWFVDGATYPLVLDPLIGTATEALANVDSDFADVAYDAYTDTYAVVWTQFYGGGSTGIVGSVWLRSGMSLAYAFGVNQTGDEDSVRVCHIAGTGVFVMVWVNRAASGDSICGIALEPSQAQATNVWTLYGPGNVGTPVLSGEATVFDDDCLVAWLDGTYGLIACSVTVDAQLQVSATPIVQIAGGNVAEPAISKQGGNIGMHVITWVDRPVGQSGWVRAQVVDHDMNLVGPGVWVQNVPQDAGYPAVDGDGFLFLVAWEQQEVTNPSGYDIKGRLLTVGANGVSSLGAVQDLVTYPGDLDIGVDVARLGDKFGICYEGRFTANPSLADVYFLAIARNGVPIGAEQRVDLTLGNSYVHEYVPRLIGRCAGDATLTAQDGLLVFSDQSIATADANIGLQEIAAIGRGGPVSDLGGGCGPGGLAATNGPFALGNSGFEVELFGAQPLSAPFLLIAWPGPHQSCGVCTAVSPWASSFVPNVAGYGASPLPLPGAAAFVGVQLEFQFATFLVNYVGCPLAPGLALSNIVRAGLDY